MQVCFYKTSYLKAWFNKKLFSHKMIQIKPVLTISDVTNIVKFQMVN